MVKHLFQKGHPNYNVTMKGCFRKGHKFFGILPIKTQFKKGHQGYWRGKKMSEDHKRKLGEHQRGEKSSFWKGGITPLTQQIRHCFKYRQWRSDIFTRDNFTCVVCGIKSGNGKAVYLEADHYPKTFSQIFQESKVKTLKEAENYEEFWNINNGRTVCKIHNPRGLIKS